MKYLFLFFFAVSIQAEEFRYRANILDVHDGDTITCEILLGMGVTLHEQIRINGIDAPELSTPEGKKSAAFLKNFLKEGSRVIITTEDDKHEKYGRLLAEVSFFGQDVSSLMIEAGMAKEYHGGKR